MSDPVPDPLPEPRPGRAAKPERVLPGYVTAQAGWYARGASRAMVLYVAVESTSIGAAAAVPVAIAAGGPDWLAAGLGALSSVSTGVGQAFSFRENWVLRAGASESIKAEIARFEIGAISARGLIGSVAAITADETGRWSARLGRRRDEPAPAPELPAPAKVAT